jgi:hypothetical protein
MKRFILTFAVLVSAAASLQSQTSSGSSALPSATSDYTVVARGPHNRIWQRVEWETDFSGQLIPHVHRYTELATGLEHLAGGQWVDSTPEIDVTATGAQATNAQHTVTFLGNINAAGAVTTTTPDGKHLTSNILGLSYFDSSDSNSVWIAQVKDSTGQLLPSMDRALFQDAFSGASADVLYINSISGFEQLVILTAKLPDPAQWGMADPSTIFLQVITEFLSPPQPLASAVDENGVTDQYLDFGVMKMGRGYAFALGSEQNKVSVLKRWLVQDSRFFLIESVRLQDILPLMQQLPDSPPQSAALSAPAGSLLGKVARQRLLPSKLAARATPGLRLAAATPPEKGLALDYTLLNSQTNFLAQCDTTYFVNGSVSLSGSNVFEGGAIFKSATNASTTFQPGVTATTATFLGSSYRPTVFTAKDDNSIGESISGSTGTPVGYYANPALRFIAVSPTVANVRIAYAAQAIWSSSGTATTISNSQILSCQNGLQIANGTGTLRNVLMANVATNFNAVQYANVDAQNVTFANSSWLATPAGPYVWNLSFVNCIFANITNIPGSQFSVNANYNGFYNTYTFGGNTVSCTTYPFQSAGVGAFYAADNSPFIGAATTNVAPGLVLALRNRTTRPPVVFTNVTFSTDTTFAPQAQRETGQLDLGWAYDPLDYIFGGCTANANLAFAPGTAVGWFRTTQGWYHAGQGIHVGDTYSLTFNGTATVPCYWVRWTTVQEGIPGYREPSYGPGGITGWTPASQPFSLAPVVSMRFTKCSVPAWECDHMRDDNGYLVVHARDCEFWGGGCNGYCSQLNYTNCLFDRVSIWTAWNGVPSTNCTYIQQNCLNRGGMLDLGRSAPDSNGNYPLWFIHDTACDNTSIALSDAANGNPAWTQFGCNAYLTGANQTVPAGTNDLTVTNFNWQTSWLGNFYLPTNSTLIDSGSVTNAALPGFYHYTTQTNQVMEANSPLDRSYHYVAVSNGVPISTGGDGLADYIKDTNGDGIYDAGDIGNWQTNDTCGDGITDYVKYLQGRNLNVKAVADTNGLTKLTVYTPLK